MTLEELSRVSEAMGIQSNLPCFFLWTRRWIRSLVSRLVGIRGRYGGPYRCKSVYGWAKRTGMSDFGQQRGVAKQEVIFAGGWTIDGCLVHRIHLDH